MRLDDAARDVAELTQKLHGDDMAMTTAGPPRGAMLGINIGGDQNRADGVEIKGVSPAGPAEAAGLRTGDVIVAVDGKALRKSADRSAGRQLVEHLRGVEPGQVVKIDYLRDGKKATAAVKTSAAEPPMARILRQHLPMLEGMQLPPDFEQFLGGPGRGFRSLELVPITPKLGQYFGADKGLLVVRAPTEAGSKLEEGDVILSIGGRTPENPAPCLPHPGLVPARRKGPGRPAAAAQAHDGGNDGARTGRRRTDAPAGSAAPCTAAPGDTFAAGAQEWISRFLTSSRPCSIRTISRPAEFGSTWLVGILRPLQR